jgi:hypothetical protein
MSSPEESAGNSDNNSKDWLIPHRFKPGQSGNPSGRPKRKWLTEATEEMLEEKLSDPKERKRWQDAQWEKMLKNGVVGQMYMDKAWERTEGRVPQDLNLGGEVSLNLADAIAAARKRVIEE